MYSSYQLPPGWRIAYTTDGKVYYLDDKNKTTHWHLPQNVYQQQINSQPNNLNKQTLNSNKSPDTPKRSPGSIQSTFVEFKKPPPFIISSTPKLTGDSLLTSSGTVSNELKDTFEVIDDFFQPSQKSNTPTIKKDNEVILSSDKKIKPNINLFSLIEDKVNLSVPLPYAQIKKSFNYPPLQIAINTNICPCGKEFGYLKHQKQQCKCCRRYFGNDCLNNQKCILCNYHQDGKCLGVLLTYCESSNYKDANLGLQTLITANSINTFPPKVIIESGMISAILTALKHPFCCLSVLNLLVALRQHTFIRFTDKELSYFGRLGSTSDDGRIIELCIYLLLAVVIEKLPLPSTLFELISLPRSMSQQLYQSHILRLALSQYHFHPEITMALISSMKKQNIVLSSVMIYDLIQLLPNSMILGILTFSSFNPTQRLALLNSNILSCLIPTAESLQITINLIDSQYTSFFEGHMQLIAHLLTDEHALTGELSKKCCLFLSSPQKEEFITSLIQIGAVPLLLRSVITDKIGIGLNIVAEAKLKECVSTLLTISENNEVREQWLGAMKALGGINKDMTDYIFIVVNCIKQQECVKSALELMLVSESIIEMIKQTDDNLIALLQTEYRGGAAKVILKAFQMGEKQLLINKGLFSAIAQSIESECNEEVLKLIPLFIGETQSGILLQRIIHKIAGTYLLQTQFTQISLETLVLLLCKDQTILPLLHSVQINGFENFMQFLVLRIFTAKPEIKICYLQLLSNYMIISYCDEIKKYSIANIVCQLYFTSDDHLIVIECIKCLNKLISLPQTCGSILYRQIEQKLISLLFSVYSLSNSNQVLLFEECIKLVLTLSTLHPSHLPILLPVIQLIPFNRIPNSTKSNCLLLLLQLTSVDPSVSALIYPALSNLTYASTQILAKLISISTTIIPLYKLYYYFTDEVLISFLKTGDIDLVTRALEIISTRSPSVPLVRSLFKLLTTSLPEETKLSTFHILEQILPDVTIINILPSLNKILPLLIKLHRTDLLPLFSIIMTACPKEFSSMIIKTNLKEYLVQSKSLQQFISLALTLDPIDLLPYFLPLLNSLITSNPIFVKTVHSALSTLLNKSESVIDNEGLVASLADLLSNKQLIEQSVSHFKVLLKHQCFVHEYLKNGVNNLIQFYKNNQLKEEIIEAVKQNCCEESLPLLKYILEDAIQGNENALNAVNQFMTKGIGRECVTLKNKDLLVLSINYPNALCSLSLINDTQLDSTLLLQLIDKREQLTNKQLVYLIRIIAQQMLFGFDIEPSLISTLLENNDEEVITELLSLIVLNPFKYSVCLKEFPLSNYHSLEPFVTYLQPFII
ncbi:hypothetical protein EHI8A_037660 [Entamoeba histolytica HM-1:IMSS-B]|uniref:WW domain-containing protein n=6 Tax=Entamoeba histolytica TaxID=5759 RepID=C4LWL0_ENTH1|nr:hypothetical protein EHI_069220 [Entamoeba histolytica HM-1:IMSS]EMD43208.1 WW domain containing protein [Entamoeba histolytica KU27]EMH74181.1 hypothetical protein EHI8A_037660 [Entamoeba histolytica HM-1:IMSS-B]EMS14103.1 hypothetical protein KM1_062350 [Entamoeba histolytica HM-3:IMSS]ENY62730.1 hypothetical protein EHI7A_028120 [Entamoeba histolytica HM-1:IMSS-A]GAT93099.1 hypothetical protein CL6EHI_069220 [Entamoeba histolytica]|eukprot:XP_655309.1 hypothetical protein EHI_069220 [Entamoeba histolytica HM-1:IMSS]